MTGVLNALAGSASGLRYSVTIGNSGTNYGYNDAVPMGSISPAASYNGVTIRVIAFDSGTFSFTLSGTRTQSHFAGLEIQKTDGTIQRLNTSAANFDNSSGTVTFWSWTVSSIWTSTSPSPRSVRIF
jgi:hypothetical protein